jgi:flagellar hook-associated protein 1
LSSTFYGFEIAKTGLFAAQRAIDLTGHNISNANTVGYTRQRLMQSSRELISGRERILEITKGVSGEGVRIDGVEQVRDNYLDTQFRRESGAEEMWSARSDAMGYIEQLFNETGDSGLSASINNFFTSLNTLTMNPESKEYRTNVMQNALMMTDNFKHLATQLTDKQMDQNEAVRVASVQINDIAKNIADLNDQIFRYELNGDKANDLRDQRNNQLDQLAGIVDIDYSEDAEGEITVLLGGKALVDKDDAFQIDANATKTNPIAGGNDLYELTWHDHLEPDGVTHSPVVATSGTLTAYIDMRDGNSAASIGIPYLMGRLDTLAATIADQVNTVHNGGYTMPDTSNGNLSVNNVDFFDETSTVTASNFDISAAIKTSVFNIAAAGAQITPTSGVGDNANAMKLEQLQNKLNIPIIGSIEGYLKGFVSEIGVEASHTNQMRDSQQSLVDSLENQRQAVSGVSVDEEMTNLVKYQHSYDASARVITAIDEYLDTLINKMGLVGR